MLLIEGPRREYSAAYTRQSRTVVHRRTVLHTFPSQHTPPFTHTRMHTHEPGARHTHAREAAAVLSTTRYLTRRGARHAPAARNLCSKWCPFFGSEFCTAPPKRPRSQGWGRAKRNQKTDTHFGEALGSRGPLFRRPGAPAGPLRNSGAGRHHQKEAKKIVAARKNSSPAKKKIVARPKK